MSGPPHNSVNDNFEYCQRSFKKYVPSYDSLSKHTAKQHRSLFQFSSIPMIFPCVCLPVSCMSPMISFGNHPELANDKASPHTWSMRWVTDLRMRGLHLELLCLLESHWWHWGCEENLVKCSSSPSRDKSAHAWFQKAHLPFISPLLVFISSWYCNCPAFIDIPLPLRLNHKLPQIAWKLLYATSLFLSGYIFVFVS